MLVYLTSGVTVRLGIRYSLVIMIFHTDLMMFTNSYMVVLINLSMMASICMDLKDIKRFKQVLSTFSKKLVLSNLGRKMLNLSPQFSNPTLHWRCSKLELKKTSSILHFLQLETLPQLQKDQLQTLNICKDLQWSSPETCRTVILFRSQTLFKPWETKLFRQRLQWVCMWLLWLKLFNC